MTPADTSPLLTDLYQLTMLQGYAEHGVQEVAVFEFFARKLPEARNYLVAAGLDQVLDFLETFRFSEEDVEYLASTGFFHGDFLSGLEELQFEGDAYALPEGTLFFEDEPLLRVVAPIIQAQVVETRIINLLQFQTLVASKAARVADSAPGKQLVDFGLRRAHGSEAGLLAARASYLAGFAGTSTVLAGREFGVPIFGTMAHSFVQAHESEVEAFRRFARSHPDNVILLIDTYDTEKAARVVVQLAPDLAADGIRIKGVRLDSGDLGAEARMVRKILDDGGLTEAVIFASGDLDEYRVRALVRSGAPIDGFGVGTRLDVSVDAPYLNCAYKLVEYSGRPVRKRSEGKATLPGRKQVFRTSDGDVFAKDVIGLENETCEGLPLLRRVMAGGQRIETETLKSVRRRVRSQLDRLPDRLRVLERSKEPYPVSLSPGLGRLRDDVDRG